MPVTSCCAYFRVTGGEAIATSATASFGVTGVSRLELPLPFTLLSRRRRMSSAWGGHERVTGVFYFFERARTTGRRSIGAAEHPSRNHAE